MKAFGLFVIGLSVLLFVGAENQNVRMKQGAGTNTVDGPVGTSATLDKPKPGATVDLPGPGNPSLAAPGVGTSSVSGPSGMGTGNIGSSAANVKPPSVGTGSGGAVNPGMVSTPVVS